MRAFLALIFLSFLLVACGSDRVDRDVDVGPESDVEVGPDTDVKIDADKPVLREINNSGFNGTGLPDPRAEVVAKPDESAIIATGSFVKGSRSVTGDVTVKAQGALLTLEISGFSVERGPELHFLLATDEAGTKVVDLGELTSYGSYQLFTVPAGTDLTVYDTVLLWSVGYREVYGSAALTSA